VQNIRHTAFKGLLNSSSLIIEVGGNTGLDTSKFIELYDPFIISFEPIISMANGLIEKFKKNPKIDIQPYGLGNRARNLSIELVDTDNTGSSIFRKISAKDSSKIQQIELLDIISVIENIRKTKSRNGIIDMISMNCEGCEFEILPALILHNMTQYIRTIQFASHMDVLTDSSCIYCQIEQALERTHLIKYQYVMLWEAWVFKNR
jgi:FkbM family methyltransferase